MRTSQGVMLNVALALAMGFGFTAGVSADGAAQRTLPEGARLAFDAARPGWRVAPVTQRLAARVTPSASEPEPNVLSGDFDGNGESDYAVLVAYGSSGQERSQLLVALQSKGAFRAVSLRDDLEADPNRYLYPRAKGTKLYDLNRNADLLCEFDAIGVHYDCCGCTTFIFKDGKFQSFWTCD